MNRLLLMGLLMMPALALANGHHHSSGGSSHSSSNNDADPEGACVRWAPADAGVDAGVEEEAEAADAGHPGEVCAEPAKGFGCSVLGFGLPTALLAALWLKPRRKKS